MSTINSNFTVVISYGYSLLLTSWQSFCFATSEELKSFPRFSFLFLGLVELIDEAFEAFNPFIN